MSPRCDGRLRQAAMANEQSARRFATLVHCANKFPQVDGAFADIRQQAVANHRQISMPYVDYVQHLRHKIALKSLLAAMLKNIWKDPVWSKVIATAILAAIGLGYTYATDRWSFLPIIDALAHAWTISFSWITSTSLIPNWLSLLTGLLAVPTVIICAAILWNLSRAEKSSSHWKNYTEDKFFGILWRWRYTNGSIVDPYTFCPHCDFQIYPINKSSYIAVDRIGFQCDSCHSQLGIFEESYSTLENKAIRFAQQKIRNGTWNEKAVPLE